MEQKIKMNKQEKMNKLKIEIEHCKKCDLWKSRNNFVLGEGSLDTNILFIGEAPGYWEDQKSKPFVGRSGKVLDEILDSIGLKRRDIYIANIIKCRPPNNRNPLSDEIKTCTSHLDKQIAIIQPKIIATLGNFALEYIFKKFGLKQDKIGKIHGNIFDVTNLTTVRKVIPLYHPATVTYNSNMKDILIEDFKLIGKELKTIEQTNGLELAQL